MTIRQYAKDMGFTIVGKLTPVRQPQPSKGAYGKLNYPVFEYRDEAGNEYYIGGGVACIVPFDSAYVI